MIVSIEAAIALAMLGWIANGLVAIVERMNRIEVRLDVLERNQAVLLEQTTPLAPERGLLHQKPKSKSE